MKFTYALTAVSALAGAAYSAPTASDTCVVSNDLTSIDSPSGLSLDTLLDIASPIGLLVSGLGLSDIAPGLVSLIDNSAGNDTAAANTADGPLSEVTEIAGLAPELVTQLVQGLGGLKCALEAVDEAVTAIVSDVLSIVEDLIEVVLGLVGVVLDTVTDLLGLNSGLQIQGIEDGPLSVVTQVASPLSKLLCTLGLDALDPALVALLSLLGALA